MLPESSLRELRAFAGRLADVAGEVIRAAHARNETEVETKPDGTPVTVADKEAERRMRELIAREHPSHGVLGEEFGEDRPGAEFCWVLDPIDGTRSFLSRVPLYVTLVGLRHAGKPVLGLIDQPVLRERVIGDNRTCEFNGRPVRVAEASLAAAVVVSTDLDNVRRLHKDVRWSRLADSVSHVRTWGDGYGHLMVATGRAHVMADPVMNPWDLVPVLPVLRGAGAVVTAWDGGDPLAAGNAIAAAPRLHAEVMAALRD
ncbi:MAG: hypothetical protein RJA37_146 [Verrucomicrobiota bacterium]